MQIHASTKLPASGEAEWLVVPLFDGEDGPPASLRETPTGRLIGRLRDSGLVGADLGETTPLLGIEGDGPATPTAGVQVVGLGKRASFDAGAAYSAGVAAAKSLAGKPRGAVAALLPDLDPPDGRSSAFVEGMVVGTRGPGLRKTEPNRHPFASLTVVVTGRDEASASRLVRRAGIVAGAVNLARELTNITPSDKNPVRLADRVRDEATAVGLGVEIWDETRIVRERFGGLVGVAAGSDCPPRFVVLRYERGGRSPTLAMVGKGVTFDSGGLSLKPSASMEDMKSDMTGAAVVLAAMTAAARLGLAVNVVGYLPMTENMTGGGAMKLGDVLTMRDGKTVEVLNTDAEGRLILADALSYAVESKPARLLDLATLTGACIVALGTKFAGLFSNDDAFADGVLAACRASGERAWRLPLDDDFKVGLKSSVADLKNVAGRWGGAASAAMFLKEFVGETPWVHLDIAGPSWSDADSPTRDQGGSGCFVRTLVAFLEGAGAEIVP